MLNSIGLSTGNYGLCGNYLNNNKLNFITPKEQKQQLIKEQYNDIFEHEQAHKSVAGELGGPIVIEKNADGIPVKGHVDIKMPVLNKENPDETIKHADIVVKSAMAPDDPSSQDFKVAQEAKSVKSEALSIKNSSNSSTNPISGNDGKPGKSLNFIA